MLRQAKGIEEIHSFDAREQRDFLFQVTFWSLSETYSSLQPRLRFVNFQSLLERFAENTMK